MGFADIAPVGLAAEDVWAYRVGGTLLPASKTLYQILAPERLDIMEFEKTFTSPTHAFLDKSTTPKASLGSKSLTVALPTGATIRKAVAIALIIAMNDAGVTQKIDLDFEVAGTSVFSQAGVVGLPTVDGASASVALVLDVSSIVTVVPSLQTMEAFATLSDAHSTHFTVMYALIITYRMT